MEGTVGHLQGFFQNDTATLQIMAKAATILPKACDILGISLSESESEEECDAAEHDADERFPENKSDVEQRRKGASPSPPPPKNDNQQVQDSRPKRRTRGNLSESHQLPLVNRQSRKRCASTPSTFNGQSTSTHTGNPEGASSLLTNPPKKRRTPSISSTSTTTSSASLAGSTTLFANASSQASPPFSFEEYRIRRKMFKDLEYFQEQMNQLAAIEKAKTQLLEKFIQISGIFQKERANGATTPPPRAQGSEPVDMLEEEEDEDVFEEEEVEEEEGHRTNPGNNTSTAPIQYDGTLVVNNNTNYEITTATPPLTTDPDDEVQEEVIFSDAELSIGAEEIV